jgi:Domain of unknown function (DUF4342)
MSDSLQPAPARRPRNWQEDLTVAGDQLVDRLKELVREGNVRKVIIKHDDRTIVEIPLTIGVVGALLAPQLAALGAIAALLSRASVTVEREEEAGPSDD